jgi:hypothetical protein
MRRRRKIGIPGPAFGELRNTSPLAAFHCFEQASLTGIELDRLRPPLTIGAGHPVLRVAYRVPMKHTLAAVPVCPPVCPHSVRGPTIGSPRQPSYQWKTGLKSSISGPFWNRGRP